MGRSSTRSKTKPLWLIRGQLSRLWFIGSSIPFLILVVQSILGKYGADTQKAWAWFIPTTVPTLGLMVGVIGASALGEHDKRGVQKGFADLVWWLSLAYVIILSLTILLEPFSPTEGVELLSLSNYWLAPIQGLVVASLGYLFTSGASPQSRAGPPTTADSTDRQTPESS